jgi:hypothetical protein
MLDPVGHWHHFVFIVFLGKERAEELIAVLAGE